MPKELFNNYTIVSYSDGEYSQVAYADYCKEEIAEIVGLFDAWIAGVPFFSHCLCYAGQGLAAVAGGSGNDVGTMLSLGRAGLVFQGIELY